MSGNPQPLHFLVAIYLFGAMLFGSMNLDGDEFAFVREPYEMLGGDYTAGYLRDGEYKKAVSTAARAYWLFWHYRPLFSPIVRDPHKALFSAEERRFGCETNSAGRRGGKNSREVPESTRGARTGPLLFARCRQTVTGGDREYSTARGCGVRHCRRS